MVHRDESHLQPPVPLTTLGVNATSATTSSSSVVSRKATTQKQAMLVPSSPRHRSSTIKPPRPPPARLNLVSVLQPQTPNPSLSSVASVQNDNGTSSDRPPSPRPSSPVPPRVPKSTTLFSPHRPSSPSGFGKSVDTPFTSAHPTARPSSPTPTHNTHHYHQLPRSQPQPQPQPQPLPNGTLPAPSSHTGFRAHLAHLLPRHAVFTAHLAIHQLHNVPLVHGEFAIKWKVKGATSPSGGGFLDKVKSRKTTKSKTTNKSRLASTPMDNGNGKEKSNGLDVLRESDTDGSLHDGASASVSDAHSIANSSSTHSHSNGQAHAINGFTATLPIPSVVISPNNIPSPPVARSFSGASSIASMSSASSKSLGSYQTNGRLIHNPPANYLSADWSPHESGQQSPAFSPFDADQSSQTHSHGNSHPQLPHAHSDEHEQIPTKPSYSPAKGLTSFVRLKDHNVIWEQKLDFVVQMSIGRENGELGDCIAKLVVMQRVISGDPNAPRNPRLGAVYINLAQYVDAGVITRSYLLRQSKTNATLKLTLHLEHTAGEVSYVAPPLPKGEILSGVVGLLESSDIFGARPRTVDLYTSTASYSSDEDAHGSGSDASSILSASGPSVIDQSHDTSQTQRQAKGRKKHRRPFDPAKLPTINDPRGTEKLIEALFNPVPVTQPGKVTPFTYLVEVDGEGGDGDGDGDNWSPSVVANAMSEGRRRLGSDEGEDDDDRSLYADSIDEHEGQGIGESDYHSLHSQPSFQGSLRSQKSIRSIGSKVGLTINVGTDDTTASTNVNINHIGAERRTWWQKVLSPPAGG